MKPGAIAVRAIAAYNLARHMNLLVYGRDNVPRTGPAVLAARHYHHLFDGAALVMGFRRQPHLFVALDWTRSPWERLAMETACQLADWPVALRGGNVHAAGGAFAPSEIRSYVRSAVAKAAALLQAGELLAIFPEGYPTIDPAGSRKADDAAFLPFAPGILAIVERAERALDAAVPIVPVGFAYRPVPDRPGRYDVVMRAGEPLRHRAGASRAAFGAELEARVRALSQ